MPPIALTPELADDVMAMVQHPDKRRKTFRNKNYRILLTAPAGMAYACIPEIHHPHINMVVVMPVLYITYIPFFWCLYMLCTAYRTPSMWSILPWWARWGNIPISVACLICGGFPLTTSLVDKQWDIVTSIIIECIIDGISIPWTILMFSYMAMDAWTRCWRATLDRKFYGQASYTVYSMYKDTPDAPAPVLHTWRDRLIVIHAAMKYMPINDPTEFIRHRALYDRA